MEVTCYKGDGGPWGVMITFSQNGEDGIITKVFWETTGYERTGFYVDVGCNHPIYNNKTFFFYQFGWNVICIDPH